MKRDLYKEVTDKVIAAIEAGASGDKWEMPWHGLKRGRPHNAVSNYRYSGINVLMLWSAAAEQGYPTNEWASYRQWQERGAQVRRGERGHVVVYAGSTVIRDRDGEPELGEDGEPRIVRFLKHSHVFNASQVDGWESPEVERPNLAERIERAEQYVNRTGAVIRYDMGRAYYAPGPDFIGMPGWETFKETARSTATENAYSTLFHELTHWTGAKHRLERTFGRRFGDHAYSAEELVAEMGAAFLCSHVGIVSEPREDHAHYAAHWLAMLKADRRAIFTAASAASAAVDYLDNLQVETAAAA